jgi:Zn-dependent protease with chaperone function
MNDLLSPILAGLEIFVLNPFHCSGTCVLQIGSIVWLGLLFVRVMSSALEARRSVHSLKSIDGGVIATNPAFTALRNSGFDALWAGIQGPRIAVVGYWKPVLIIDSRLMRQLNNHEAQAVLVHEIAHAKHRDALRIVTVSAVASALTLCLTISLILYSSFVERFFRLGTLNSAMIAVALLPLLVLVVMSVERFVHHRCELRSDDAACQMAGGVALASALIKISRAESGREQFDDSRISGSPSLRSRVMRATKFEKSRRSRESSTPSR